MHKAGFVNIIGNPNVGKSTLMNALVGEKLSIITSKAQTTRHRIMGIVNGEGYQIVFSDTPGILDPKYKLQEAMRKFIGTAMNDADIILFVTDVFEKVDLEHDYIKRIQTSKVPVIIVLNKVDLIEQLRLEQVSDKIIKMFPNALVYPISALHNFNVDVLIKKITEMLPENPPYFDKEELTDKSERFFVSEIIREKILLNYDKEIPYSVEVVVEAFKEEETIIRISAIIYVMRDSQKGIIIGHQGKMLKKVGTEARKDMETFFGKKVFLETFVKVNKEWRDDEKKLSQFGYV